MVQRNEVAEAWDREYLAGRYGHDSPVRFVRDIVDAARRSGLGEAEGLYIGCGNGRNYLPLVEGGLDLIGLDVSPVAIAQLAARAPARRRRLICGDLSALPDGRLYPIVVALQVLQHGDRDEASAHVRAAQGRVAPGGLICIRVNAAGTDIVQEHDVVEHADDGSFTVRYRSGPKRGLLVHFFTAASLHTLLADRFVPVVELRPNVTWRDTEPPTQWTQWEGIWQRASDQG